MAHRSLLGRILVPQDTTMRRDSQSGGDTDGCQINQSKVQV